MCSFFFQAEDGIRDSRVTGVQTWLFRSLPDQVIEMFDKDFKENSIWKHFQAVRQNRVFDLTYENFGMSANFNYPKALEELQPMLYPENAEDIKKAKKSQSPCKR